MLYQRGGQLSESSAARKESSNGEVKCLAQCPLACFLEENTSLLTSSAVAAISH